MSREIKDFITGPVTYHQKRGQGLFVNLPDGSDKLIAVFASFAHIAKTLERDYDETVKFQDKLGEWVADAINEKRLREMGSNEKLRREVPDVRSSDFLGRIPSDYITIAVQEGDYVIKAKDVRMVGAALNTFAQVIAKLSPGMEVEDVFLAASMSPSVDIQRIANDMMNGK